MFFKSKAVYDWLIVGLGNPGLQYENTRHNVGFMAVDLLSKTEKFDFNKNKMDGILGEFRTNGQRVLVLKPQTYMNNSGKSVTKVASFYKIPLERIIILHDDISLDVGKIRARRKGSDGGQKGMRDIIELSGSDNIARIKIGVGAKPHPDYSLVDWVLSRFTDKETKPLEDALNTAVLATLEIISRGIDSAMNKYNS